MAVCVGNQITVEHPSNELFEWCEENLVIPNPEFTKKVRMGFWTGNTPTELVLYKIVGKSIVLPYGTLKDILPFLNDDEVVSDFPEPTHVDFGGTVPLYDYQEKAVDALVAAHYGILQSGAGTGKTQMGIALACRLGVRTLWITHTQDLLLQSKERAERYISKDVIGTITEGRVNIGSGITFATIQTLARCDLISLKYTWDCIICDEVHRVAGSPAAVTRYQMVLNALSARHKYGLSATVHRADGLIKTTFALIGPVVYQVPDEAVADRIMTVDICPVATGIRESEGWFNTDGTVNYQGMITALCENITRNNLIIWALSEQVNEHCLVLSERVTHLEKLYWGLPPRVREKAVLIHGKSKKADREKAIEDMRQGKKNILFATYALCKEGLDIPILNRLHLTTPQKDYAVVTQSVGRVARTAPGKNTPVVYDYVDEAPLTLKSYKTRCRWYKKLGANL